MKFSYNWLRELVSDLDTTPQELERSITIKTAECEGIEAVGAPLAQASEARVVSTEKVGQGHNQKVVVETTRYGIKTVICGAPNCRPGLQTAYLPLGRKMIDGVESDGMLASAKELGITGEHAGIIELNEALHLTPDHIIEVDNKSLTHRPDLWGHFGMAREVAAILHKKLLDPVRNSELPVGTAIEVAIDDYSLCARYSALVFENVTIQPSPLWLQYRLQAVGLNPINNIVDVTNYVLAELAQPMHAFDADKLRGGIQVRNAHEGESFAALNGLSYQLDSTSLVIADQAGAVALAGIIGGANTAISGATRRIVLESANFNASNIRKTSSKTKLRTDASMRFEKAQDPANTIRGLMRAYDLLKQVSPGIRLVGGLADAYRPLPVLEAITLPLEWLTRKLGRAVPAAEVRQILEALEFKVAEPQPGVFSVTVPSWRATKDVSIREDLVEEVGRMIGYGSITPIAPAVPARVPPANPAREFQHRVRLMAAAQGFTEVSNYSFLSEESISKFHLNAQDHIQVRNPIAADQNFLRTSLLPGICKNISDNARHLDTFRLFEIGHEIHAAGEIPHLAAAAFAKDDGRNGLFDLKRLAECLLPGLETRPAIARPTEHPHRAADLLYENQVVGRISELHPSLVEAGRAAVLDLDLNQALEIADRKAQPGAVRYKQLRRYPSSAFDLSVVIGERNLIGSVQSALERLGGADLLAISFQRDFPLPDSSRSVSFRLTVGAPNGTLSTEEVGAIRSRVIEGMRASGYDLRA